MWRCQTCGAVHDGRPMPGHPGGVVSPRDTFVLVGRRGTRLGPGDDDEPDVVYCCMSTFARACSLGGGVADRSPGA